MNARHFDHHLDFWNGFLGFTESRPKTTANPKVTKAKATLRRLARRQAPAR